MNTKAEALAQGIYYPAFIRLEAEIADHVQPLTLARELARCLHRSGTGGVQRYCVAGAKSYSPGNEANLDRELARLGPIKARAFEVITGNGTHLSVSRGVGGKPSWSILGDYPAGNIPEMHWMDTIAEFCVAAAGITGFLFAALARHETSWAEFPPMPPLARYNHVVTATEQEAADAYEDPASFFNCWDRVDHVGDQRVCIRALDKLDVETWLGETFESTMHLARIAKARRTLYRRPGEVRKAFAPWWEYGDVIADERAGYPALSLVGYDPTSRTVEYAGFCTDTDIAKGGTDPRHVLIREIHEVRALVKAKSTRDGNPVETVRVVFPEEWMARRERRPLLDVGARVYFMGPSGKDIEVTG